MELDITDLLQEDLWSYAGSDATHGKGHAPKTWEKAKSVGAILLWRHTDLVPGDLPEVYRHFKAMGCSDVDDADTEALLGLLLQHITLEAREAALDQDVEPGHPEFDWDKYDHFVSEGHLAGDIFRGDNGRIYIYMGE